MTHRFLGQQRVDVVLLERKEEEQEAAALKTKVNSEIQGLGSHMRKSDWKFDMALCGFVIPVMARGSRAGRGPGSLLAIWPSTWPAEQSSSQRENLTQTKGVKGIEN